MNKWKFWCRTCKIYIMRECVNGDWTHSYVIKHSNQVHTTYHRVLAVLDKEASDELRTPEKAS